MIKALIRQREFQYRQPATTSRGIFYSKKVSFIVLYDESSPLIQGIGECSVFPGLSMDDTDNFENKLSEIVNLINKGWLNIKVPLNQFPSINFAIETALKDLNAKGSKILYPSEFTEGKDSILINGLIWMGSRDEIMRQIKDKLNKGFSCLKLKIGALNFTDEFEILKELRQQFNENTLEIRVDANGAFTPQTAPPILYQLATLKIHSIEQPILPSQLEEMASLCANSPLPIALDEELIGKYPVENKRQLLRIIRPQFVVLKPGLLGGIKSCEEWIEVANELNIGWWITSSLETNIGLNAIAQWTYTLKNPIPQGLSTGDLFSNNISSPLAVGREKLYYFNNNKWDFSLLNSK